MKMPKDIRASVALLALSLLALAVVPSSCKNVVWSGIPAVSLVPDVELFDPYDHFSLFSNSMRQLTKLADHLANTVPEPARELSEAMSNVTHHPNKLGRLAQDGHDFHLKLLPRVDWHETPEGFVLTAATPGLRKEELSIEVVSGPGGYYLDIVGQSKNETTQAAPDAGVAGAQPAPDAGGDQNQTQVVEHKAPIIRSSYTKFQYRVGLPHNVDRDSLKAKYEDGLLLLTMKHTKKETCQRHKVSID